MTCTHEPECLAQNLAAVSVDLFHRDLGRLDEVTAGFRVEGACGTGREQYA